MTKITDIAAQLSAAAQTDADAIKAIVETAADQIDAILKKYAEVPSDVMLPALNNGRNVAGSMRMQFPKPIPMPESMMAPPPIALP